MRTSTEPLLHIVDQHVEEAGHLAHMRQFLLNAPAPQLQALLRHDQRLAAHIDAIAVAGDAGRLASERAVEAGAPGAMFAAGACAVESTDAIRVERMLSLAQALPAAHRALEGAFNWVSAQWLAGLIRDMLASASPVQRSLALHACSAHRVDPGVVLARSLDDVDEGLQRTALRCAGDLGRMDLRDACTDRARDPGAPLALRFWAARAGVLLGERQVCPKVLQALADAPGPWRRPSLDLILKMLDAPQAAPLLQPLGRETGGERAWIKGIGMLGDSAFVPWLIDRMGDPAFARVCGESITLITGCELDHPDFLLRTPEGDVASPVALDDDASDESWAPLAEDDGLPLADAGRVAAWWVREGARFPGGQRFLLGAPASVPTCVAVLRGGRQRQRVVAAEHLALVEAGRPLFNVEAPAWRQLRWLGEPARSPAASEGPP
jgi:uncharacterized protein (TIGR02270 family)